MRAATLGLALLCGLGAAPARASASPSNLDPIALPGGARLAVPLLPQQTNQWCWAASSLMVIKYFRPNTPLTQCEEATVAADQQRQQLSCCQIPTPVACIFSGWQTLQQNGFGLTGSSEALPYATIVAEIDAKRPIEYAVGWAPDYKTGHMMVVSGYYRADGEQMLVVNNPWPPFQGAIDYETYEYWAGGPALDHVTWADFYQIRDVRDGPKLPGSASSFSAMQSPKLGSTVAAPSRPVDEAELVPSRPAPVVDASALRVVARMVASPERLRRSFGFPAPVAAASLGAGVREFGVSTTALASYDASQPPESVVTPALSFLYPVVSGGRIASTIRVDSAEGRLETIGAGGTGRGFERAARFAPSLRLRGAAISAFAVRGLGLYFLGRGSGRNLRLASVASVPQFAIVAGRYEPAARLFARLAPFAAKIVPGTAM